MAKGIDQMSCVQVAFQVFTYINSFNPHKTLRNSYSYYLPNSSSEKLSNLLKVTQLLSEVRFSALGGLT